MLRPAILGERVRDEIAVSLDARQGDVLEPMIQRIRGELLSIDSQSVLIDVGGIGYEVEVPEPVSAKNLSTGVRPDSYRLSSAP